MAEAASENAARAAAAHCAAPIRSGRIARPEPSRSASTGRARSILDSRTARSAPASTPCAASPVFPADHSRRHDRLGAPPAHPRENPPGLCGCVPSVSSGKRYYILWSGLCRVLSRVFPSYDCGFAGALAGLPPSALNCFSSSSTFFCAASTAGFFAAIADFSPLSMVCPFWLAA